MLTNKKSINDSLASYYRKSSLYSQKERMNLNYGGVTDEQSYRRSRPRLIFVLKDPGTSGDHHWSWPEQMSKQISCIEETGEFCHDELSWRKTAGPLGYWSYAIHNDFPRYSGNNEAKRAAIGLKYTGMTNIKKTRWNENRSNKIEITKEACRTKDLLRCELEIMDPDAVICCGYPWVYGVFIKALFPKELDKDQSIKVSGKDFSYSFHRINGKEILFMSFYHPNAHVKKSKMYKMLREIYRAAKSYTQRTA